LMFSDAVSTSFGTFTRTPIVSVPSMVTGRQ
jgi:hypothetical protein